MPRIRCSGKFEREACSQGFCRVAGIDEAGRGSLFGPVFAAAVILSRESPVRGLKDSKLLTPAQRESLAEVIQARALSWAVGVADAGEIDRINIYQASRLAMKRAVEKLSPKPDYLLVDAMIVDVPLPQTSLIKGDARSQSIAAASILAKVHRDACMREWDAVFPLYGLQRHKGYLTAEHRKALETHGPTPFHRLSFEPMKTSLRAQQLHLAVHSPAGADDAL